MEQLPQEGAALLRRGSCLSRHSAVPMRTPHTSCIAMQERPVLQPAEQCTLGGTCTQAECT